MKPAARWSFSLLFVLLALFILKPLIINQLLARAQAYASCNLYINTARECKKAIFFDANNLTAWYTLGDTYRDCGDFYNAANAYLTAISIDPVNRAANFKVAMLFVLQKNYNRAVPHFEQVRALGPESHRVLASDPFSYYRASLKMLALCYEKLGQTDKMQNVSKELAQILAANSFYPLNTR